MRDSSDVTDDYTEVDPDVAELQDEFPLHKSRASRWKRYIGDLETVRREVGRNAPGGYINIISDREAAITAVRDRRDELKKKLISPLSEWRRERSKSQSSGSGLFPEEVLQEHHRRREIVRSELFPKDEETQRAKHRLAKIDQQLCDIYTSSLENQSTEFETKKERIIELKRSFPYLRASDSLVADVVDTTRSYAQQIKVLPDEGVRDRQVPTQLRNRILERDDYTCIRCGATGDLEAHHIIPRREGGPDTLENMATLCSDCHNEIHRNMAYDSISEFWQRYANKRKNN